jgi:hypothetical protein
VPNTGDAPETNGATDLPDLTIGQKLLLKIPDLRRTPAAKPEKAPAQKPRGRQAPETSEPASDEAFDEDEEVEEPSDVEESDDKPAKKSSGTMGRPAKRTPARSGRQPAPSPYDNMSTKELTELYKQLDNRDRLIATIAAPLGAVIAVVETVSSLHHDPALHHKGYVPHSTIIDLCVVAVVICALALVVARMRRRSLTAFALMFVGIALNPLSLGLPFVIFGGYLVFKMLKVQKVLTSRGVARPSNRRAAMRAGTAAAKKPAEAKSKRNTPSSGPRPTPSKRYTPPKPPPKRAPKPLAEAPEKEKRPNWLERATERAEQRAAGKADKSDAG